MKRNVIPASSLSQCMVDKAKELFLSGCYFTVEDLNAFLSNLVSQTSKSEYTKYEASQWTCYIRALCC